MITMILMIVVSGGEAKLFSYAEVSAAVSEDVFESIPQIEIFNHRKNKREGMGFAQDMTSHHLTMIL